MFFKRIFIIVLDGVGIGSSPDAARFGDSGANTLAHTAEKTSGLNLPNLEKLGLGNISDIAGVEKIEALGCFGKMQEMNPAKNTDAGHWEMMGFVKDPGFPTYPAGFPHGLIKELEMQFGTGIIGNRPASGTEIIKELGKEHLKTGDLIVYTSGDSVLQIAAHVDKYPVEKLYRLCDMARKLCVGRWEVGRIIARPFAGEPNKFYRINEKRKDIPLEFSETTVLDKLKEKGFSTIAYGEVGELFNNKGITEYVHTKTNLEGIDFLKKTLQEDFSGIVFGNLVDFDMLYGHRRDAEGMKNALEEFDDNLCTLIDYLREDDLMIITADHGNDPTFKGTDHTREYVPLLVYGKNCKQNIDLGVRSSFANLGKTIAENFDVEIDEGKSFLKEIKR
ncbi:MAG: phosphopentomutase [Nanoarchaeota archaeon]|nr:phosphopentomutase [Nanoarchaeota archaeon]